MKVFKFNYKNQRKIVTNFLIVISLFSILIIAGIFGDILNPLAYFVLSLISFIIIMIQIKKARKIIDEIFIEQDSLKLSFKNKMKPHIKLLNKDIFIEFINKKMIKISLRDGNRLVGYIDKDRVENKEDWERLKTYLITNNDYNKMV